MRFCLNFACEHRLGLMGDTWVMNEFEDLIEGVRKEVDAFVNEIRIVRGADMHLAFASPSEIERISDSMNQIAAKAGNRFQSLCDYVFEVSMIFDKSEAIEEISRQFARIPRAMDGKM